jgi:sugar/nucleoside kinase (ribokinase family)
VAMPPVTEGLPLCIIDSRHRLELFPPATWKMNRVEAARAAGANESPGDRILLSLTIDHARRIHRRTGQLVLVTMGEDGNLVADADGVHVTPGLRLDGPVDPVGAGDASVAAFIAALAARATPVEAAELANLAAAVTVRKLRQTGTATPAEMIALRGTATCRKAKGPRCHSERSEESRR